MSEMTQGGALASIWGHCLDDRQRDVLTKRHSGERLESIGKSHGITRERVRQVIGLAEQSLTAMADIVIAGWREEVLARLEGHGAVAEESLVDIFDDPEGVVRHALLRAADGIEECRTWAGRAHGIWATRSDALDGPLSEVIGRAPFRAAELRETACSLGIPRSVPLNSILSHPRSPLVSDVNGDWVRRRAKGRDSAYLWLAGEGEPRRADAISAAIGGKGERAIAESMRRDGRFRLLRPEGNWALSEWPLPQTSQYGNALDAMIGTLREHGALSKDRLFALTARAYPVGTARLLQCLISDRIGATEDGCIDLVERGAVPMEEKEPRKPPHMVVSESGNIVGVRLTVDHEVLRGSGVIVHNWLTWYIGLRLAPTSRDFAVDGGLGMLTVRRNTGGAQLSSLRGHVVASRMNEGCQVIVLLRLDSGTASIVHVCPSDDRVGMTCTTGSTGRGPAGESAGWR
ncbi:sigma factor-like helix-turn-helix DNA-binding protein [Streptomyces angustmyceticus]|nr:sigma factor-like helix-turn-helix DNA-binding protein [Streptomyces angustmyceticus]UAL67869.1 RNA polymerase subunit sigma-70 [Streptomyces angustmyceticus]